MTSQEAGGSTPANGSHRALLAYASIGSGHEQAVRALGEVFVRAGWEPVYLDFLDAVPSPMRYVIRESYLQLIRFLPEAYDAAFKHSVGMTLHEAEAMSLLLSNIGYLHLRAVVRDLRPSAMVSTHLFPTMAMAKVHRHATQQCLMVNCFTDYVLQPLYMSRGISWHTSAGEQVTAAFHTSHPRVRTPIHSLGIPVRPAFEVIHTKQEARALLGLPQDVPAILVMGGGLGLGHIVEVCDALTSCPLRTPATIVALCGTNADVQEQVHRLAGARASVCEVRAVGWTDQVPLWMQAADLLVSKAGGVTIAEAASVGLPLLIYQPLPGQENANATFLIVHDAAVLAEGPEQLLQAVDLLLFSPRGPEVARHLRQLGLPHAAENIVQHILQDTHPVPPGESL